MRGGGWARWGVGEGERERESYPITKEVQDRHKLKYEPDGLKIQAAGLYRAFGSLVSHLCSVLGDSCISSD